MKAIDRAIIEGLIEKARSTERRRLNLNLHDDLADPIQRFLNAGEPDTYTRPHRHGAGRWELFVALRGEADLVIFADDGAIASRTRLRAHDSDVVEIPGACWHSIVYQAPGTVLFELKPGPYVQSTDKEFAAWAPEEGGPAAKECANWLATGPVGSRWTCR